MASPIDPRLIRLVPPVRGFIVRTGVAQALESALVIARGVCIGTVAAKVVTGDAVGFLPYLVIPVVLLHGLVAWAATRGANRSVGAVIDELREQAMAALTTRDPREVEERAGYWRHVLTKGLGDFRPYLTEFLPALVATCVGTPLALAVVFSYDWVSGLICVLTLPLIPFFMVLIGKLTADHTRRRLEVTAGLGTQLADLLAGAPTLRAMHTTERPARQIRESGARHEGATMGVLRLAFLSSFALEFLATLSVAVVAVSIGLRLVVGEIALLPGLVVLIIVPEVFNPVRRIGASYHAAADGLEAADAVLSLIDADPPVAGSYLRSGAPGVRAEGLSVSGRDGTRPKNLSFHAQPGTLTVLTGANGSGKSTALLAVLGTLPDSAVTGTITIGGDIAYLPARPAVAAGTVAENLALMGTAPAGELAALPGLPLDHRVAADGSGISAGQRQRVGLARVLAASASVVLLDEPTAHLSPELAADVIGRLRTLADEGRTVLVASHDHRVVAAADEVVAL
ncbi:ATP-binding cassette domain-containing protein [Corynebacterium sp. TA-R-1]|uniref:ATP-binding cassette domain-containing protein n=1 Tax=Corynebacterium stercoris TaxID=2943490 RepID=A0ABT1G3N9_9CORY|nr:ABC transporter transmembrane domain-containing protein [Corynebacterium stercoris]MCP1388402.1 ATP-binding cassette domain-containing protein [Corynebacterium stercoris]